MLRASLSCTSASFEVFIRSAQAFRAPPAAAARRSRGAPVSVARARVCARARARHERGGRAAGRGARRSVVGGRRGRVGLFAGGGALREAARAQGQRRRQVCPRGAAREVGGAGAHARARGRRRAAFFFGLLFGLAAFTAASFLLASAGVRGKARQSRTGPPWDENAHSRARALAAAGEIKFFFPFSFAFCARRGALLGPRPRADPSHGHGKVAWPHTVARRLTC